MLTCSRYSELFRVCVQCASHCIGVLVHTVCRTLSPYLSLVANFWLCAGWFRAYALPAACNITDNDRCDTLYCVLVNRLCKNYAQIRSYFFLFSASIRIWTSTGKWYSNERCWIHHSTKEPLRIKMNYLEEMWTQIRNMKRLTINVKRKKNMKIKVQINFMLHSYFHVFFFVAYSQPFHVSNSRSHFL